MWMSTGKKINRQEEIVLVEEYQSMEWSHSEELIRTAEDRNRFARVITDLN